MLINCLKIAKKIWNENLIEVSCLKEKNIFPKFVIFQIGNNFASEKYVKNKIKKADFLGIEYDLVKLNEINEDQLIELIKKYDNNISYNGILVQLPLPKNLKKENVFKYISNSKNIDGAFLNNDKSFDIIPCTPLGIVEILDKITKNIQGKHVVLINRSDIVGKPLIPLLLKRNVTLTICHSKTKKIKSLTLLADILIVGVGIPNFIKKNMVKKNCIVIDVGINFVDNKMCGDCDKKIYNYVKLVSPVPNGVGQLTLAMFYKNLLKLTKIQNKLI